MKAKYYVNIENGSVSQKSTESGGAFGVYADEGDLGRIQEKVNNMQDANRGSYVRSHSPFFPQDLSPENARYDRNLKELYGILHELGDEQTREHIESLDILRKPGDHLI